jgi:PhnB protein
MIKSHIYPGGQTVNCYLSIKNCAAAIEFYKKAFGAVENLRLLMPDGVIAHAEIMIEGTLIMMAEENPDWGTRSPLSLGGSPVTLSIYVEDVDASFSKAIEAGATMVMPVKDEFYGDRIGQVVDPYGYKWGIATHVEDVSQEEMQTRMNKLFEKEYTSTVHYL